MTSSGRARGPGVARVRGLGAAADPGGAHGEVFLRGVRLDAAGDSTGESDGGEPGGYPFALPVVSALRAAGELTFDRPVTFLVGHNGSGKSTLIEAIAVAAGLNPEGGSTNFRFATADAHSSLGAAMTARFGRRPRTSFFLRAESFFNVASEIDRLDREGPLYGRRIIESYGGVPLHERSHGESFLDLLVHRFGPGGLYVLDEPEAALSPQGTMAALARIHELVGQGSQFVVATHSPILLAVPGARILEIDDTGAWSAVDYDDAMPVVLTRAFLADPARSLADLLDE